MADIFHYCTYFDRGYLSRGLALYRSLVRHSPPFVLWVLCLDKETHAALTGMQLDRVRLIALGDFEQSDAELRRAKLNRSRVEYYFTCSPLLPLYVFDREATAQVVTYLDADLFFFGGVGPVYEELGSGSVLITEHRFPPHLRHMEAHGVYNVGLLAFRRDERGLACLRWWRERCLEWCHDYVDGGRFADQKYLDQWPHLFEGVVVSRHNGLNLAPWNLANCRIRADGDRVWVDEQPLILFHFHGLRRLGGWLFDPNLSGYDAKASATVRRRIYAPYIRTLLDVSRGVPERLAHLLERDPLASHPREPAAPGEASLSWLLARRIRRFGQMCRSFAAGEYIVVMNGRAL